jgi:hypothetical protein
MIDVKQVKEVRGVEFHGHSVGSDFSVVSRFNVVSPDAVLNDEPSDEALIAHAEKAKSEGMLSPEESASVLSRYRRSA